MADRATWARRVADWRASGLTSEQFCNAGEFSAGALRHWSHKLRDEPPGKPEKAALRLARVLRVPAASAATPRSEPDAPVVVELGAARVLVRRGFDRATLSAVLEVLAARGGAA